MYMPQDRYFNVKPLNIENFIKVNKLQEIFDPIFFSSNSAPTPNGLLSNQIFGITKDDRANTFAYISLGTQMYIHPLFYKTMCKLDSKIPSITHGIKNYSIKNGELVEDDENGGTGINYLYKNYDKIKFKKNESESRNIKIDFLTKFKDKIFIKNVVVIPAYYRDVNSEGEYKKGVGDINKLYDSLIIAARSLKESQDYGLSLSDTVKGRVEDILVDIYDWFTKEQNGIAGKTGILHRAGTSKTTDYSARLVISAANLKVENMDDMMCDLDHSAIPLASIAANFFPYIIFYMRRFFENLFSTNILTVINFKNNKNGSITYEELIDYRISFSDTKLKEELDRFIHGYANRLRIIEVPLKNGKVVPLHIDAKYKEAETDLGDIVEREKKELNRDLTWCDLIYMAAVEVTQDKMVVITRYPIDNCYNQFATQINVSSTKETEPLIVNGKYYPHYPKIRQEDIGTNTSSKFLDTVNLCNAYLDSIGGDYDGDQISCKSVFSVEANNELKKQLFSKNHYIGLNGNDVMTAGNEALYALYSLTMHLRQDDKKFTNPIF
jgi:hypothetical protein